MELPGDAIGPTDILAYRDCPRRMSYGMRRHVGVGKQSQDLTPEAGSWATDYGSAIHLIIHELEEGTPLDRAIQIAWNAWGRRLEPGDLPDLRADAEKYVARDFPGTRTVLNEGEIRVPLMRHRGRMIYFRTRIDRLLERIDEPGTFVHVDYKSSRHPKSEGEVRDDLQLWMTNWAIHEYFPECEQLVQIYDQLKFGQQRTRKTKAARKQVCEWIKAQVTSILEDEDWRDDGLLAPARNDWCSWCPLMESCPVVQHLSDFARVRLTALAPTVKRGRKTVMELDPGRLEEYVALFGEVKDAEKILDRYAKALRELLVEMPASDRERLGYTLRGRKERRYSPEAIAVLHDRLGDRFYELVKLPKTDLEAGLADDPDALAFALGLAEEAEGTQALIAVS